MLDTKPLLDLKKVLDEAGADLPDPYVCDDFSDGLSSFQDLLAGLCCSLPNKKQKYNGAFFGAETWAELVDFINVAPETEAVQVRAFHFLLLLLLLLPLLMLLVVLSHLSDPHRSTWCTPQLQLQTLPLLPLQLLLLRLLLEMRRMRVRTPFS